MNTQWKEVAEERGVGARWAQARASFLSPFSGPVGILGRPRENEEGYRVTVGIAGGDRVEWVE